MRMGIVAIIGLALLGCEPKVITEVVEKPVYIERPVDVNRVYVEPVLFQSQEDEAQGSVALALSCKTEGAAIYYTTDGSDPTTSSRKHVGGILKFFRDVTVKAIAVKEGLGNSPVSVITISISTKEITISYVEPVSFTQTKDEDLGIISVTMSSNTEGVAIYYTTDGNDPTNESNQYEEGQSLKFNQDTWIKAVAVKEGIGNSAVSQIGISFSTKEVLAPHVEPVLFQSQKDKGLNAVLVAMSCATEDATIYYTTNEADPTTESSVYVNVPLSVTADTTVKAFAVKAGLEESPISQICILISTKEPTIPSGTYTVKHLKQDLDQNAYTLDSSLTDTGKECDGDMQLDAVAKTITGFTATQMSVDGSEVTVFYDRKTITYTYHCRERGKFSNGSTSTTSSGLYGAPIEVPVATDEDYYYDDDGVWLTAEGTSATLTTYGGDGKETGDFYFTAGWKKYTVFTYRINDNGEPGTQGMSPPKFTNQSNTCVFKGRPGDPLPAQLNFHSTAYYLPSGWKKPDVFPDVDTVWLVSWNRW